MRLTFRCPKTFDELDGDGPDRFCRACGKTVVDLSLLSEEDAEARVRASGGLCGHVLRDGRGGWVRRSVGPLAASALVAAQPCVEPPADVPVVAAPTASYLEAAGQAVEEREAYRALESLRYVGYIE